MGTLLTMARRAALGVGACALVIAGSMLAAGHAQAMPSYRFIELADPVYVTDRLRVNSDGTPRLAGPPVGDGYTSDGNSSGVYARTCGGPGNVQFRGCTLSAADGLRLIPFYLPPSTQWQAYAADAYDVNERGDVLGGATSANAGNTNVSLQIFSVDGVLHDLGFGSYRRPSFNNEWEVVGSGLPAGTAFYFFDGMTVSLSSLVVNIGDFIINGPTDINDAGYIAGYGTTGAGQARGFILAPVLEVPEPTAMALVLLGLVGLVVVRRKRRPPGELFLPATSA